jgi:CheY-like chemotaxis protein
MNSFKYSADHERGVAARRATSAAAPTVLLAAADDSFRRVVATALGRDGYQVLEAASAEAALVRLAERASRDAAARPTDLLLTDVRMSGEVSGVHLAEAVRAYGWSTPVLLMTGTPNRDLKREADRLRAVLLVKPFGISELRRIVLTTLAEARARSAWPEGC